MWSVDADPAGRILHIQFTGNVGLDDAKGCAARLDELLEGLEPGFCVLTDLSQLEQMALECGPVIDGMMDRFNRRGVTKVIRVVPEPQKDIGLGIMSLFHYNRKVRVLTCKDLAQAQEHLP